MAEAALIARYLCHIQPLQVRNKLLDDPRFGTRFGLVAQELLTLGPDAHTDRRQCYATVRRAFADQGPASLMGIEGQEIAVKVEQGYVVFELPSRGRRVQVSDFMCLSPNHEQRTRTLRQFIDRCGPTAPDFSALLTRAEERELSDDEVNELFTEATTGVAALQRRAISAFQTHQATLQNLVPDSLVYFERFCGPSIASADHEEYFRSILPQYRRDLIRRDLIRGLDICLQGALRDDLMPSVWTEHTNDDQLWEALTACDPWSNPFALLGALDIAVSRQHDERYRTFAEEAVGKLVQERFPLRDGIDAYELLPLWADWVLDRINNLEGGVLYPPCWKRMCAWMEAGFLTRLMQGVSLELERFGEWVNEHRTLAGEYAKMLDLRHEPMYRAAEMSPRALHEEVIGRLAILHERHKAGGRIVPGEDTIREVLTRLASYGLPLRWELPGPLDGHRHPEATGMNKLPDENIHEVTKAFANDRDASILSILARLAQRYDLGEESLARMREMIVRNPFASEETGLDERFGRLIDAGLVACAQRDEKLANAIASTVVATAHWAHSGSDATNVLQALLVAGAAFQREDAWALWLEEQLTEVASRLPAGEPSKMFLQHLQELKKVLKLNLGIHVRAEALASAAN